MSQPKINCAVCGGNQFTVDSGFYFCLECNTQSQDVREVVFEEFFSNQKGITRVLKKKSSRTPNLGLRERLTSWEVLNYIVKGITDELLNLGAKAELKIVTLQLWASYLRKLDVAFTSVEVEHKPRLGYAFKRCDAEIVYGLNEKQLKCKSWLSRSGSISGSSMKSSNSEGKKSNSEGETSASGETKRSFKQKLSIRKKALASAEYSQMSQCTSLSFSQTLDDLDNSLNGASTPQRVSVMCQLGTNVHNSVKLKITKHAKELLASSYASSDYSERRKLLRKEIDSIRNLTVAKIAALSTLALTLTNQEIQVSDFIRWVDEGHISLRNSRKLLPEGTKLDTQTLRMLELGHLSYTSCHDLMMRLCGELRLHALPPPDLTRLAERYCLELQLPCDLVSVIRSIHRLISRNNDQHSPRGRCYEIQAVATIVVALKLLFSLDDCTEYHLSHTANELNNVPGNQMFVFSNWMKFIECRKAVVSTYHYPTRTAVYGDSMGRDSQLFIQLYSQIMEQQQPVNREINKRYVLNQTWVETMVRCLRKLADHQPQCERLEPIHFPASLTPLHTYCQILLSQRANEVDAASPVLSQNFMSHSLDYILYPNRVVALSLTNDLNIVQRSEGAATIFQVENIAPNKKFTMAVPRFKINQSNIAISVVKNISIDPEPNDRSEVNGFEKENQAEQDNKNKNSLYREVQEIISDDSDDEENNKGVEYNSVNTEDPTCHTVLQLFNTASQYWCIHVKLSKNDMNNDEFNDFAMKSFPSSFLWLLRECSRTVNVSTKDLYSRIISIEKQINDILNKAKQKAKRRQ